MRAKILLICTLFFAFSLARADSQAVGKLEVAVAGQVQKLDEPKQLLIKFWFHQLMLSALYRDVVYDSSLEEWRRQLSLQSRIHCTYPTLATLAIPERQILTFDEALMSATKDYPEFVYVRRGSQVMKLGKYDPWVFHKLLSETGILRPSMNPPIERALF
jgi:hypothetical protein